MRAYLLILPVAVLVAYSQVIVKWRTNALDQPVAQSLSAQLFKFLSDPVILSAYGAALIASFAWLYIVTKLPLATAFPAYIGVTFAMVLIGGWLFLGEPLSTAKVVAALLILSGIIIGVSSDA